MAKRMKFDAEAREALRRGFDQLADAVRVTLGPCGRSVVLDRRGAAPMVSNDGVTIAREIELPDPFENIGAQLGREVSTRTQELCGDGTTTAVVLAQAMIAGGHRAVISGANPMAVRRGMERAVDAVVEHLATTTRRVRGADEMRRVAAIASRDEDLGALIAEALGRVGRDGVVTVEEGRSLATTVDVVQGLWFDRGYLSPYFVTDPEAMSAVLEKSWVLLSDQKISATADVVPALEIAARSGRPVLLVAEEVEGDALAALVVNRLRGTVSVAAVKAPGFGERRRELLEDLAVVTRGRVLSAETGRSIASVTEEDLGRADRVTVEREGTTVIGGGGTRVEVARRIAALKARREAAESEYDREQLDERLARLTGGVAVLRVGAPTEPELRLKRDRLEDALAATRAAVEEGLVPGGGLALVRAEASVRALDAGGDERIGIDAVADALGAPLVQIAANAGYDGATVLARTRERRGAIGFDAVAGTFGDLTRAGIADPAKVLRVGLRNAVSIAGLVLATETLVAEVPDPEPEDEES